MDMLRSWELKNELVLYTLFCHHCIPYQELIISMNLVLSGDKAGSTYVKLATCHLKVVGLYFSDPAVYFYL